MTILVAGTIVSSVFYHELYLDETQEWELDHKELKKRTYCYAWGFVTLAAFVFWGIDCQLFIVERRRVRNERAAGLRQLFELEEKRTSKVVDVGP